MAKVESPSLKDLVDLASVIEGFMVDAIGVGIEIDMEESHELAEIILRAGYRKVADTETPSTSRSTT